MAVALLIEGLPAVLFSFVILKMLPDGPARPHGSNPGRKSLAAKSAEGRQRGAHLGHEAGVMQALLSPKVWMIGAYFFCALTPVMHTAFPLPPFCKAQPDGA
jgi:hypothetical protein